jgi:hypothetical protein
MVRWLMAIAAGTAAANAALLSYPGDVVPQIWIVGIGVANATMAAMAAYLSNHKS